jgi:miniconductance mechanosensitive channel
MGVTNIVDSVIEPIELVTLNHGGRGIIFLIVLVVVAVLLDVFLKRFLLKLVNHLVGKTKMQLDDVMVKCGVFSKLAHLVPGILVYLVLPFINFNDSVKGYLQVVVVVYLLLVGLFTISAFLESISILLQGKKRYEHIPVRGFIQVLQIILFLGGSLCCLAIIMGKSPLFLLGSFGAFTAIIMLIFKDSILGLVAGVQLSANKMLNLGDWLEMPKYGADGDVIEISLTTVKVQNWDKTITTVPSYALISDSFKNWKGMTESGGRRIKRAIYIDMTSIKFLDDSMIDKFKKMEILKSYIEKHVSELEDFNKDHNLSESPINGRKLTNVGTFRAYLVAYLKNNPMINKDMTFIIRQLAPTSEGLPLEVYVFCKDNVWANYEGIQSDIFDHILASIGEFDLRVYQSPTGADFKQLRMTN